MIRGTCYENSPATVRALVVNVAGEPVAAADVVSVLAKVWDTEAETLTATLTPTPADVFLDHEPWEEDETGFNFSLTFPGSSFPNPGNSRAEIKITPVTGDPYYVVGAIQVERVYSE